MSSNHYYRAEVVDNIISEILDAIERKIITAKAEGDQTTASIENLRYNAVTSVRFGLWGYNVERLTAEQVAAENAEEMANAEGVVSEIVDVLEDMVKDENTVHILVQGHDRNGWTDEEVFNDKGATMMQKVATEIAGANKGYGEIWVYSKGLKNETFTELQIQQHRIEAVLAEIRRRVQ